MNILRKFRSDKKVRQSDMAEALGVSQGTISKIECGDALPSLELAVAIERVTKGAVSASSWVPEVAAAQKRAGGAAGS